MLDDPIETGFALGDTAAFLVNHLVEATTFAALVALLALLLRRSSARVRYRLLGVAAAKFFLPSALIVSLASALGWSLPNLRSLTWSPADRLVVNGAGGALVAALIAVWCLGAVFACCRLLRAKGQMKAWLRDSRPVESEEPVAGALAAAMRRSGLPVAPRWGHPLQARWVEGLASPAVWGLRRPYLLLPLAIDRHLSREELDAVLLHELEHLRRRDHWAGALQRALRVVFWFHPLVWWLDQRLLAERERACDERVVALGGQPRHYARGLLKVVRLGIGGLRPTAMAAATASDLERRIAQILHGPPERSPHRWTHAAASAAVVMLLGLSVVLAGQGRCDVRLLTIDPAERLSADVDGSDVVRAACVKPPEPCMEG
ncbi:MAG: M56 family metallopeptidase [Acidobacteriota bacterium]